jgi:hypothetical protein
VPAVLCRVETPAPLSEIQKGDTADSPTPQGLTKCGSKIWRYALCRWRQSAVVLEGKLFVTYAVQDDSAHDDVAGMSHGIVNTFDF